MSLFEAERHEPLVDVAWNEARARSAMERIVADTHQYFDEEKLWPIHPLDRSDERPSDSMKPLYFGAAGVIWALTYLAEVGATEPARDYLPSVRTLRARHRDDIQKYEGVRKYLGPETNSFMMGETGMLLLEWKLAPAEELASEIYRNIEATLGDPRGLVWGSAGSMLPTLYLRDRTSEERWDDLFRRLFDALWAKLEYVADQRCSLWKHDLYGVNERRIGALHGFAANMASMLRGRTLLPRDRQAELLNCVSQTVLATALRDGEYVNWPARIEFAKPFVQYCNGAPGIISALVDIQEASTSPIDELTLRAGELVWLAGPLVKLPVLCHGTPGNGYAFLKLFARTGKQMWLDRARAFAMHAIVQNERALEKHGQRKFSLWTGDVGFAIYLWNCLRATADFPMLDVL